MHAAYRLNSMESCKNCNTPLSGNYCSHCGQSAKAGRLDWSFIGSSILHFFTHLERGFLFTSWNMLLKPGTVVQDYVRGKRKSYQGPISYFLIWAAVTIILIWLNEILFGKDRALLYSGYYGGGKASDFASHNLSGVLAMVLPVFSLYFWLFCSARKYHYVESLVSVFFVIGTILMLQSAFVLLTITIYMVFKVPTDLDYSDPQKVVYLSWFCFSFLRNFPVHYKWLRGIAFIILAFGTFTAWRLIAYPWLAQYILN
ncbi:MAG TPA: DUF3667 domain-containing protein [Saprospiraceae bacterium]|nr:DUF3667 domain-containing protein [Saprospiraceae bacterium]